ncbi:MAG TPA: MerR family transcriptional regulator [Acidimicrobiales bacterium]|nr:MerR family transcriptional regulator [Acidimicrobiales bacterium]
MSELLTIGEVAERAGVRTSALRYYDELGLLPPATRVSGRRRYTHEDVARVGVILLLTDVGFTLAEVGTLLASRARSPKAWHELAEAKIEELRRAAEQADLARRTIEHALHCPHDDILDCPRFWAGVGDRLAGRPLAEPSTVRGAAN